MFASLCCSMITAPEINLRLKVNIAKSPHNIIQPISQKITLNLKLINLNYFRL